MSRRLPFEVVGLGVLAGTGAVLGALAQGLVLLVRRGGDAIDAADLGGDDR